MKSSPAVEEAELENVHRQKANQPAGGQAMPDFVLDPATPLHRPAPEAKRDGAGGQVLLDAEDFLGLQGAVVIVLGDEMLEAAMVVVLHLALVDIAHAAADNHVLVDLALLVAGFAVAEK